jgi:ATP-dependent Clp protease ATP-binding subunit ClpC
MYEPLGKDMEQVIALANEIAREYGQDYVGTEHLLLAIARQETNLGARILRAMKIDEYRLKQVVDRLIKQQMEDTWVFGRLPGTPHFRNVMSTAIEEARQLESKEIRAEHLLLALLREKGSVAFATLEELGLTVGKIRPEIVRLLTQDTSSSTASRHDGP